MLETDILCRGNRIYPMNETTPLIQDVMEVEEKQDECTETGVDRVAKKAKKEKKRKVKVRLPTD